MPPRFSVVIPTRERPNTLRSALATCLNQEFDDYEILVCDNGTSAATRRVVDEIGSARLRYVRAPRALAMSDNWELAVSEARGEFILVLGDDDGLMPYALRELDALLTRLGTSIVRWSAAFYTWPDVALAGDGDYLRLPMGRTIRTLDARTVIASVIRFEAPYVLLPMLYNAAVHRSLVDELKRRAGRVFVNCYPDVFTGFAFGYLAGHYPSIDVPMTIAGSSGGSFGIANLFLRGVSPLDADFRDLNHEARLPSHRWVPDLSVFPEVPVADSFQLTKEALFPDDDTLCLDRQRLIAHCLTALPVGSEREPALAIIRETVADDPALTSWLDATLAARGIIPRPAIRLRPDRLGFDGESLHLDTAAFGVTNVQEAVELAEKILQLPGTAIDYSTGVHEKGQQAIIELKQSLTDTRGLETPGAPATGAWLSPAPPDEEGRLRSGCPKVSIVTPSFNQGRFLEQTIRSVLDQGYPNLEYIVIDGQSTDESVAVIQKYAAHLDYWVSERDKGQADALNKGFARTTGEIVAWINSDDFYYPGAIAAAVAAFQKDPGLGLVYGRGNRVNERGERISEFESTRPFDLEALVDGIDYILQPTTFMRRQALHDVGPIDSAMHYAFDWDLWIRLGKRFSVAMLDSLMAASREYAATKTSSGGFQRTEEIRRLVYRHTGKGLSPGYLHYLLNAVLEALPGSKLEGHEPLRAAITIATNACQDLLTLPPSGNGLPTRPEIRTYPDGWMGSQLRLYRQVPRTATFMCLTGVHDALIAEAVGPLTLRARLDGQPLGVGIVMEPGPFCMCWRVPAQTVESEPHQSEAVLFATSVPATQLGHRDDMRWLSLRFEGLTLEAELPHGSLVAREGGPSATDEIQRAAVERYYRGASAGMAYEQGWVGPEFRSWQPFPRDATAVCLSGVHDELVANVAGPLTLWASVDGHGLGLNVVIQPGPFKVCWMLPDNLVLDTAGSCEIVITTATSAIPSRFGPTDDNRALAFRFVEIQLAETPPIDAQVARHGRVTATEEIRRLTAEQYHRAQYRDGWVGPDCRLRRACPSNAAVMCLSGVHDALVANTTGPLTLWAALDGRPLGLGTVLLPGPFTLYWTLPPISARVSAESADGLCEVVITTATTVIPSQFGPSEDSRALAFRFVDLSLAAEPPPGAQPAGGERVNATNEIRLMAVAQARHERKTQLRGLVSRAVRWVATKLKGARQ